MRVEPSKTNQPEQPNLSERRILCIISLSAFDIKNRLRLF